MTFTQLFEAARRAGAPLVAIRTADPAGVVARLTPVIAGMDAKASPSPVVQWDQGRGFSAVNKAGSDALAKAGLKAEEPVPFVDAIDAARKFPPQTVLFAHHAHRQLLSQEPRETAGNVQVLANLRDPYKRTLRMVVALGPSFAPPPELEHDVVVLDEPLPEADELGAIVTDLHAAARREIPTLGPLGAEERTRAVDALTGLSRFAAEQVVAMSLTADGLDVPALWERKRVTIEQTPGLSIWRGRETFADIVGCAAIKAKLRRRLKARTPLGVVVWIDEVDKALAHVEHDTSGVRQYQLLKLLSEMENNEWTGFVAAGVAGAGKSLVAKALGNEAGVPTIALDLGASESKYVGESEANLLRIMQVVKAVGHGRAYFVATSNASTVMRPELQRRFADGFWMFDLMTAEERAAAWAFYMKRYALEGQPMPDDAGWTAAEIRNCCRAAWDEQVPLAEAATTIVPMSRSRADEIERLRTYAHGRFLDASKGGAYQYDREPMEQNVRAILIPRAGKETVQ